MKILGTLQIVLGKMDEKEVVKFRKYARYKDEKTLLRLFELLYKHIEKKLETSYLLLFLKKKRIKNLRTKCNDLYKLLIKFWNDNPPQKNLNQDIDQLINGASVLIDKGLIQQGLELFEEANVLADKGEKFIKQQDILRMSMFWSAHIAPNKKVDEILQSSREKIALLEKKIKSNYSINLLNLIVHHKLMNDQFYSKESNKQYQNQIIAEVTELIEQEDCAIRTKIIGHSILSYIHISGPEGNFDLFTKSRQEAIRNIEKIYETDPRNYLPILVYSIVSLLYKFFTEKNNLEFDSYLTKFRKIIVHCIGKDKTREYHHYEIELINCLMYKQYSNAQNVIIPNTLNYLEEHDNKIPFSYCWSLYVLCFEIYFSTGNYEQASVILSKIKQDDRLAKLDLFQKYHIRLYEFMYYFELRNFVFVENNIESTRRLYSSHLKKNKGGKILLKYLLKLSTAPNDKSRIPIFLNLKSELEETFKSYYYAKIMGVNILMDWITAKINNAQSIQAHFKTIEE